MLVFGWAGRSFVEAIQNPALLQTFSGRSTKKCDDEDYGRIRVQGNKAAISGRPVSIAKFTFDREFLAVRFRSCLPAGERNLIKPYGIGVLPEIAIHLESNIQLIYG